MASFILPIDLMRLFFILYLFTFSIFQLSAQADLKDLSHSELDSLMYKKFKVGDYQGSISVIETIREKIALEFSLQDSLYAEYTNYLGLACLRAGKLEKVESYFLETKAIYQKLFDEEDPRIAQANNNLAVFYHNLGQYEKAEARYLEVKGLNVKNKKTETLDYASLINNLASLYQDMGHYEKAEPLYLETIRIKEKRNGRLTSNIAKSINNIADLYKDMKAYSKAEKLYLEAIDINEKTITRSHPRFAAALNNLANLYTQQGAYAKAEPLYLEAIEIRRKTIGTDHPDYVLSINNMANLYKELQAYEKAEAIYLEVKDKWAKIYGTEHPHYAQALNNLALVQLKKGLNQQALELCIQSIDANCAELDSTLSLTFLLESKALTSYQYYSNQRLTESFSTLLDIIDDQYKKEQDKERLQQYFRIAQVAMLINESIRHDLSGEKDKLRTLRLHTTFIQHGIDAAYQLNEASYLEEAFGFAEQNKSILLSDAIRGNRARNMGDLPDTLITKEIDLQKKLSKLKQQQLEAKTDLEKQVINKNMGTLHLEIGQFLRSVKDKYPKYHALKYENITAKAKDIQAIFADPAYENSLLLEYFQTDSMLYLFAIGPNTLELFPLPISKKELHLKIKDFRKTLSAYAFISNERALAYQLYTSLAHWFYQNTIQPALVDKKVNNLIIISDGELGHIPFETFLMSLPKTHKNLDNNSSDLDYQSLPYLLNDYNISYNFSATLLKENIAAAASNHNGNMLACAAAYQEEDSTLLSLRLPEIVRLRKHLKPLDAAQKEVSTLAETFVGDFWLNDEANEKAFKEKAAQYSIIHLAMHGILNPKYPMLSSLAFTEDRDSLNDNFLQAFEIARLHLKADLVVLSACETGYGKFEQGEGVVSLARAFMYSGTPSLVVSLWPVNDLSTSVIMELFYKNLSEGSPKDLALSKAKKGYLEQARGLAAHPAFWSPFVQIGDSRPIQLRTQSNTWFWIGAVSFLFLMALCLFFRRKK